MSTSSSGVDTVETSVPVTSFSYRDMGDPASLPVKEAGRPRPEKEDEPQAAPSITPQELQERVRSARGEAVAETEARLTMEYDSRSNTERAKFAHALELFQIERRDYFSRVEADVVQLALAIAAKILHREAQVDPMLVAALVRFAVDKLHDGSSVSVRVSLLETARWRASLANPANGAKIEIIEDAHLAPGDCILTTELGSTNFSIDAQMKEVEKGFFDLLAQRPVIK
jgi:flagellar biosynthesis/type III secretory pathway protein FliH